MRGGPGGAETDGARQWRHFLVAPCRRPKVRRSRRQHSDRCRHPIPASLLRPLPFPRFARVRATPNGFSRVRPPSSSREVRTLSDSALEPSSRRPAPGHQPIRVWARFKDLGLVSPRALSLSVRVRPRPSTFPPIVVGRSHPSLRPMRSLASGETTPLRPSRRPMRSALSSRAMVLIERVSQPMLRPLLSPRNPSVEGTHCAKV